MCFLTFHCDVSFHLQFGFREPKPIIFYILENTDLLFFSNVSFFMQGHGKGDHAFV